MYNIHIKKKTWNTLSHLKKATGEHLVTSVPKRRLQETFYSFNVHSSVR